MVRSARGTLSIGMVQYQEAYPCNHSFYDISSQRGTTLRRCDTKRRPDIMGNDIVQNPPPAVTLR